MIILELFLKILIGIGSPVLKSLKKIKKIKLPKIIFPKIKWPKIRIKKRKNKIKVKPLFWLSSFVLIIIIGSTALFYLIILKDLPKVDLIYNPPNLSTVITDRNNKILYKFYENENRTWKTLEQIPQDLIEATIAIEDKNFYNHHGLSIKGLITAVKYNFKKNGEDKPRGGSTITQQLVKNVFLSSEKTLKRKIREAVLTLKLENKLSKDEILERYLNQVSYGGEAYGVQEASLKYFGKNVEDINLIEAAYLAGLPAAPSSYSPYGNDPGLGVKRAKHVIEEMVKNGYLTENEAENWLNEKINIKNNLKKIMAPHFVFYIKNILETEYGYTNLEKQGLTIKTSLDLETQNLAEEIVAEEIGKVKKLNIKNGASLVVDVKSGDILAMVGSKNYYAKDIDGKYNVATALRQPGSSIKPINYLLALKNGFSLSSTIDDSPVVYKIKGQKPYSPQNYNGKYMGRVTLRTALASSLNIPSVKLLEKNGVNEMIDLASDMGITTWEERNRFGLSLALGSGEIKMTEISQAYSIFANLGEKIEINPILEIKTYLGESIYQKEIKTKTVVEPEYAYMINDVLSDNQARSPIFGSNSKLVIKDRTVAVKTGTTNNLKDNWCVGWTPEVLVAVWVGNNSGEPMSWVASGVSGATPIWNRIMTKILENKENVSWVIPNNLIKKNICNKQEWTITGSEIAVSCPVISQPVAN
ncbi:MAG: PBP1A family penicillin-binding protein [Candidatus Shapirobacteria bacterium]|nr:PBP1A family penicillin-binding protein [Candidatus Shapirobacteria bacterium]